MNMNKNQMVATIRKLLFLMILTTTAATAARADESTSTGLEPAKVATWWYSEEVTSPGGSFYLYSPTANAYLDEDKEKMQGDINHAVRWTPKKNTQGKFTLEDTNGYKLMIEPDNASDLTGSWHVDVNQTGTATALTMEHMEGDDCNGYAIRNLAWYLSAKIETFTGSTLSISKDKDNASWILVSESQKECYDKYSTLFKKVAKMFSDNGTALLDSATHDRIEVILMKTSNGTFNTYYDDIDSLETALKVFATTTKQQSKWFRGEQYQTGLPYYMFNPSEGIFLTDSTPEEHSIENAPLWLPTKVTSNATWTFKNQHNKVLYMEKVNNAYVCKIDSTSTATTFQVQQLSDGSNGFILNSVDWAQRFCIVNEDGVLSYGVRPYSLDDTDFNNCTWYFITPEQKEIFVKFNKLYYEVKNLKSPYALANTTTKQLLATAIAMADTCCYYTVAEAMNALQEAKTAYYAALNQPNAWWYGEDPVDGTKYYLYNAGTGTFLTNVNTPTETNIENAITWTWSNKTFSNDDNYFVYLERADKKGGDFPMYWSAKVTNDGSLEASTLDKAKAVSDRNAYIFYKLANLYSGRMCFGVRGGQYSPYYYPREDNYPEYEWILISQEQKEAYIQFFALYNQVEELASEEKVLNNDDVLKVANGALATAATCTYKNYAECMIKLYTAKRMMQSLLGKDNSWWEGETLEANKPFYMYNVGGNIFANEETPSVSVIDEADTWTTSDTKDAKFTSSKGYKIYMDGPNTGAVSRWVAKVDKELQASTLWPAQQSTRNAYTLSAGFNANYSLSVLTDKNSYGATSKFDNKDEALWLFISKDQKACHATYDSLYTVVAKYAVNPTVQSNESAYKLVLNAMSTVSKGTYSSYESDKEVMLEAIRAAEGCIPSSANWWCGDTIQAGESYYIYHLDDGYYATQETPQCKDIDNATLWTLTSDMTDNIEGYLFNGENGYNWNITRNVDDYEKCDFYVAKDKTATKLLAIMPDNAVNGEYQIAFARVYYTALTTECTYMHLGIENGAYMHSDFGSSNLRDEENTYYWLFISERQRRAYKLYSSAYEQAYHLYISDDLKGQDDVLNAMKVLIDEAQNGTYATYDKDIELLNKAIKIANEAIAAGIENVDDGKATASDAKVVAIYGMDGVRRTVLGPGVNILKMSDGTTVKVTK